MIDNTNQSSIENFFEIIKKEVGSLDVLINNAQIKPPGFYEPFEKYNLDTLNEVLAGNLSGVAIACKEACKLFNNYGGRSYRKYFLNLWVMCPSTSEFIKILKISISRMKIFFASFLCNF